MSQNSKSMYRHLQFNKAQVDQRKTMAQIHTTLEFQEGIFILFMDLLELDLTLFASGIYIPGTCF